MPAKCTTACLAVALLLVVAIDARAADYACDKESELRSTDGSHATTISFINLRKDPVKVYWLTYAGQRKFYVDIAPGAQHDQPTYLTHPWVITDVHNSCLEIYLPNATARRVELQDRKV
ncbi:hypothetical protein EGT07_34960, partial [Herbaspirillum sp. HC18]